MKRAVRVLIVDDRPRSRDGLRALLTAHPAAEVVGEATDGREAVRLAEEGQPDVVVMDVRMPAMDGLAATQLIKQRFPEIQVVMLTMYSSYRAEALASGADAFVVKGCPLQELLEAVLAHRKEGGDDTSTHLRSRPAGGGANEGHDAGGRARPPDASG